MIRIVTDSACDLPTDLVERAAVTVVPLTIRFGDDEFVDRRDLDPAGFWGRLRSSAHLPETAAPGVGQFLDAYGSLAEEGAEGAVVVCMSSRISATYQSAVIAAEQADLPVKVVDSRSVSMALGYQVLAGTEAASGGGSLDEVAGAVETAIDKTGILAALDTLEFLKRGGRIGGAQALLGSLLDIKPLITLTDGVVAPAGRVRTRSKAVAALVDRAASLGPDLAGLALLHAGGEGLDQLRAAMHPVNADPVIAELGAVVGTHTGPGVLGIAYRLR